MTCAAEVRLYAAQKTKAFEKGAHMQEDNIRSLNVNQMIDLLSTAYISLIHNGTPFSAFPSVMLWGPPGVGKSQGVRQIAERITAETGRTVAITDVRLLLFNPVDLRGIPTANACRLAQTKNLSDGRVSGNSEHIVP